MSLFDWFELSVKLGLIVLFLYMVTRTRPLPVQFEPCPWNGPTPDRWLVLACEPVPGGWLWIYSDSTLEYISPVRVVSR